MRRQSPYAVFLLLLALALPAAAGVGIWTPIGPEGGTVWSLTVDPVNSDTVYAGGQFGIFKSTDRGQTWNIASRGLGLKGLQVSAIVAAPGVLYAGSGGGNVFKSTDGGRSWTSTGAGPDQIRALAVDPRAPNKVWASASKGLFFSSDGGKTWKARRTGLPRRTGIWSLAFDPAGRWLYAGGDRGVLRSADEGKTWKATGLLSVYDVEIDPADPAVLYAATGSGVYRSQDRGAHWKKTAGAIDGSLFEIALQGGRIYGAGYTSNGKSFVAVSLDRGETWTRTAALFDQSLTAFAVGPGTLYAGFLYSQEKPGGLVRSLDGGATWEPAQRGFLGLPVQGVAVDPSDHDVLYAGTFAGLFKTSDGGDTWELLPNRRLTGVREILVDPADASVYAATGALFRSTDGGETWQELGSFYNVLKAALDLRTPGALWVLTGSGLYHLGGAGEEPILQSLPPTGDITQPGLLTMAVDPRDPEVLYVAGVGYKTYTDKPRPRLFRSADGGKTWERSETGLNSTGFLQDLAVDPHDSTVYAAMTTGLYRSTDGGRSWQLLLGLKTDLTAVSRIAIAPTSPTALYVAVPGAGVLRSTDRGQTWTDVKLGVGTIPLLDLAVDPQDPGRLYAATATRGIYTYTDPEAN